MFDFVFGRNRRCDGANRRDFLRVGGLSALGLSLPSLLRAQNAHDPGPKPRAKSVILVYLGGGLSHHDSFDLKPDAPEEIRGKYKPIDSNVSGLKVGELLPKTAQVMDKVCLIRSGHHNNDHHETATNWVMSGRFGSAFGDWPAIGAVAAQQLGFRNTLPPYVAVPKNPSFTWELGRSAFLGGRYESFKAGDPNEKNYRVRDLSPIAELDNSRSDRRRTFLQQVDQLAKRVEGNDLLASFDEYQQRAASMVLSSEARDAFAIEQENDAIRDRYGRNTFGQSCLLAKRLVARGVRFVTVNYGGWDHHGKIFEGLDKKLPELDAGYASLIDDMQKEGLLQDTLVVLMGEFGRTPKINKDAGRDHWAPAGSLVFAGAGVKPGTVIGATDRDGAFAIEDFVRPADVAYTILASLGINPRKHLTLPDGRPAEILDEGREIEKLYA